MISDEKIFHIVHLILDGLEKENMVSFLNKEEATRETKKICLKFISKINRVTEVVEAKIMSQKNPPPRYSQQWEILFNKYFEEEITKLGGGG